MKSTHPRTAFIHRALFAYLVSFCFTSLVYSQPSSWTSDGPYVDTDIYSLAMAVSNPDILYAGTSRGVFKSVDSGLNWTRTGNLLALTRVVQVDPTNSDVVFAGTDDGIYKSDNGGSTWTQKALAGVEWVNTIAIDPGNPDILYAGTGKPGSFWAGETVGIFKSSDGGETWLEKLIETDPGQDYDAVTSILVDSDNSSTVYAATNRVFLKSTDGGETWVSKEIQDRFRPDYVVALAMTPTGYSPPAIYAIKNFDRAGVYKSQDGGETWTDTNIPHIDSNSPWAMAVDPNNPNVIYVGTTDCCGNHEHLYKSTNGGNSWSLKDSGLPDAGSSSPSSMVIDPRNSDVLVSIEDGGVYKSSDGAGSWNFLSNTLDLAAIKFLAVHPTQSSMVFTSGGPVAYDPQNPSTIWKSGGISVSKSTDDGQNWTSIQFLNCIPGPCDSAGADILISPVNSDHVLVGTSSWDGVFVRTTDGGQNWWQLGGSTTALAADPNNSDVVYMGKVSLAQVFRYNNVWVSAGASEITGDAGGVRDMEVDSDSKLYVAGSNGLWTWDDSGWESLTGIPTDDVTALTIDQTMTPGTLYVGTGEDGVFVSQDGGNTWIEFNDGLGSLSINVLAISDSEPKMIYAGTARGLWSKVVVTSAPSSISVGGTVSGLAGTGLVLQNNAGDNLAIGANGGFTFASALADGSTYAVTVMTQPTSPSQTCMVSNGTGTLAGANVTNVAVSCTTDTLFQLNAGLNDAWYYSLTDGQGFFITVFPELGFVSLAWFTYDTELPPIDAIAYLGDAGHRWLTALGPIVGNQVTMDIDITSDGIFDTTTEIQHTDPPGSDGTITLTFHDCNSGTIEYDIPSINKQGFIPITRVADDNVALCEALLSQ